MNGLGRREFLAGIGTGTVALSLGRGEEAEGHVAVDPAAPILDDGLTITDQDEKAVDDKNPLKFVADKPTVFFINAKDSQFSELDEEVLKLLFCGSDIVADNNGKKFLHHKMMHARFKRQSDKKIKVKVVKVVDISTGREISPKNMDRGGGDSSLTVSVMTAPEVPPLNSPVIPAKYS